jgi:hypothetical protein
MQKIFKEVLQNKLLKLRRSKPALLGLCAFLALLVVTGSTLAWYIVFDSSTNHLTSYGKGFTVTVVDDFDPTPDPAGSYEKRVGAVNQNEKPAFVRLLVMPTFLAADGKTVLPAVFGTHVMLTDINLAAWNGSAWNGGDWAEGGDGYYYYLHVLPGGASTDADDLDQNLFNHVKIADTLPIEYQNAQLRIEVKCEAVGIQKWHYRLGWWGHTPAPTNPTLNNIDVALAALAQ